MSQGDNLAAWRLEKGLSQGQAATRIGVTQGAWAAWERGFRTPSLACAFDVERLTAGRVKAEDWPRKAKAKLRRVAKRKAAPSVPPPSKRTGTDG